MIKPLPFIDSARQNDARRSHLIGQLINETILHNFGKSPLKPVEFVLPYFIFVNTPKRLDAYTHVCIEINVKEPA